MDLVKKMIQAQNHDVYPYTGAGITVAVMDSGIALHPDVRENIAAFRDFVGNRKIPYDDSGHGTHVAGALCGKGTASRGRYTGIAPCARIVVCKVLDEKGEGCIDDMMDAVAFCIENKELYGIRILSISVGLSENEDTDNAYLLSECLEKASDAGILVIVAAGNNGPKENSMSVLGNQKQLICVGCYDGEKTGKNCFYYSGRGPAGQKERKPDIVAPGTGIVSCNAWYRKMKDGSIKNPYQVMDGTSMAVPLVSGAAALLWEKYPDAAQNRIKEMICHSAKDLGLPWNYQGWGLLNVKRMLEL